jgi:hypothetical protein
MKHAIVAYPSVERFIKMANSRRARIILEFGRRLSLRAISAFAFTRITEPYRAMAVEPACDSERRETPIETMVPLVGETAR